MVQMNMHELEELTRPFSYSEVMSGVPARVRSHLGRYLQHGGVLPRKTREAFIALMVEVDSTVAERVNRLERKHRTVRRLKDRQEENLALQKDTVGIALRIAGIEPDHLVGWQPAEDPPRSFLDGLPGAIVREDAMILADFSTLPGFEALDGPTHVATRSFRGVRDPSNQMTVIMANRLALEQQTGADLIYFNEKYRSFVMVQYKAMEEEGGESRFRWRAGDQFTIEVERMEDLREAMDKAGADDDPAGFRFSENPFFLKFCRRVVFAPDTKDMFRGMYLPLDLWQRLRRSGRLKGPKGGNVVTFANVERGLSNTEFMNLVSKSWVGTSMRQSAILATAIREVLATGKTITIAVKHEDDTDDSVDVPTDTSPSAHYSVLFD